jgi:hypothetical protein
LARLRAMALHRASARARLQPMMLMKTRGRMRSRKVGKAFGWPATIVGNRAIGATIGLSVIRSSGV